MNTVHYGIYENLFGGNMRKIELLCPASSLEVLKIAVIFGADAVYIGGEAFGLRAKAKNFSPEEMATPLLLDLHDVSAHTNIHAFFCESYDFFLLLQSEIQ